MSQTLAADLFLLHAPSVFDFRERGDILFAYLSDSDSVNVTPVYEMYPLGFLSMKAFLAERGLDVRIVNVASLMLMHPRLDVRRLIARLEAPVFGLDLHWMAQCHGAVELAALVKEVHPESLVVLGGISATIYARELIAHPGVDAVVQGYDTLEPLAALVRAAKNGGRQLWGIPNLVYKADGVAAETGFSHRPQTDYNDAAVDWSFYRDVKSTLTASKMIMTLPNTGCAHDCGWCGGSRQAFSAIMGSGRPLIHKDSRRIDAELRSLGDAARKTSIYALQCYSEPAPRLHAYLDAVKESGYARIFFEQYRLTDSKTLKKMVESAESYILLSPESHDPEIGRLSGRGNYTMAEMEEWIARALELGVKGVMVWFFIGMPKQTPESVEETVDYAERLMAMFGASNVLALVCPMVPFLDPGSRFFERPDRYGYRLFHRTLEEHRRAMIEPLWYRRLNYETEWMSRRQIQEMTYEAAARLAYKKGELGLLAPSIAGKVLEAIGETRRLLREMENALAADGRIGGALADEVRSYNRAILAHSTDQIVPVPRAFGGRWFDDFTVPAEVIRECET